ncbi:MAG: signal peptide peptidase SppA [Magnetococcales bacterium]|nr:signal peptide peptidase SppA [Magnetococcales bacterium]
MEESRRQERLALEQILDEHLREQRKTRRGRAWFRVFIAGYLLVLLGLGYSDHFSSGSMEELSEKTHTAVVDLRGVIMPESEFSAEHVNAGLRDAFENKKSTGVILRINSPGGSAVQAGMIYDEMVRLREKYPNKPLYAVLEDLCASGGYYVAAGAQEIYADKATLVGSIGVIMRGFGLKEAMEKLGIENRVLTAGEHKSFLDPFDVLKEDERKHALQLLSGIHGQFIQKVREGRGKRLKEEGVKLFSGLIWTGEEAVRLGLVDGLGGDHWVAREKIKATKMINYTYEEDWMDRFSKRFVESAVSALWRHGTLATW